MYSRAIVSTTISAIVVLLSYVWYRRRVKSTASDSQDSSSTAAEADNVPGSSSEIQTTNEEQVRNSVRNKTCIQDNRDNELDSQTNYTRGSTQVDGRISEKQDLVSDKLDLASDKQDLVSDKLDLTSGKQDLVSDKQDCKTSGTRVNCETSESANSSQKQDETTSCRPSEKREETTNCSCPKFKKTKMGKKKRHSKLQQAFDPDLPNKESLAAARLLGRNLMTYPTKVVAPVKSYSDKTRKVSVSSLTDELSDVRVSDSAVETDHRPVQKCSISSSSDADTTKTNCASSVDSASQSPADDMLASTCVVSDSVSVGSSDSGKGGSDDPSTASPPPSYLIYEFEMPQKLCPRLIGRYGSFIQEIKTKSGATVLVKQHPSLDSKRKLVAVEGTQTEVDGALQVIRSRFPLKKFPAVTLEPWINTVSSITVPDIMLLTLPQDVSCDVVLSSLVSPGHLFLQQPTHPSFPSLQHLEYCMSSCYSFHETPGIPVPVEVGIICAAPVLESWYRAQIVSVLSCPDDSGMDEVDLKILDHGGYCRMPVSDLRQIRSDFMGLAFQAVECFLANVTPNPGECGWSLEAMAAIEEVAHGVMLQAQVSHYTPEGIPNVHLHRFDGGEGVHVNRELVNRGLAQWVEVAEE